MTAAYGLRFGPLALRIDGPPPHPLLDPWRAPPSPVDRRVVVTRSATLPAATDPATAQVGFALAAHPAHDEITLAGDPDAPTPWLAALCELVARDAPTHGCLLLHAGAVTVAGGVALLVAPPGTGKTTAVRAAGTRAFASNAVLLEHREGGGAPMVRAMPFTRDPEASLESMAPLPLAVIALVHRSPEATVEWIPGPLATMRLMSHVTRPRGDDPHARLRAALALDPAGSARWIGLGLPRGPGYLAALDAALHRTTDSS